MNGIARHFFTLAVVYALAGMAIGLQMAITQDHSEMPAHAHVMVAGWLMSAVFAFFYHLVQAARESRLASAHFWLSAVSGTGLTGGLYFLLAGHEAVEPLVAASSLGFYAAMVLFAVIALPAVWRREGSAGRETVAAPRAVPVR